MLLLCCRCGCCFICACSVHGRYHEEQIWSDKIRRASTWGTFALMGVNVVLFIVVQIGFEPWRRKRLVRGFEEKVKEVVLQAELSRGEEEGLGRQAGEEVPDGGERLGRGDMGVEGSGTAGMGDTTTGIARHHTYSSPEDNTDKTGEDWILIPSGEEIPAEDNAGDREKLHENTKPDTLHDKKDLWITAAGGMVMGSFITALGTYFLSR